jgi:hypothetical protein
MYRRPRYVCVSIALALLAAVPGVLSAATLSVDPGGKTGYLTIQAAVDAARDGDVVVVAPGTYTGSGNCDIDLRGKAITIQSADPENADVVQTTVVDCQGTEKSPHRGFYVVGSSGATISGLTITNGLAQTGGAVYCENSDLTLAHCRIIGNATLAGGAGAGVSASASTLVLQDCEIRGNTAGDGADSPMGWAAAGGDGGGVYAVTSIVYLSNCTVADNAAGAGGSSEVAAARGGRGGGIHADSLLVTGSSIVGNTAGKGGNGIQGAQGGQGGGVYCTRAVLDNCIIQGNTAGAGGDSTSGGKGVAGKGGDGGGVFCADSLQIAGSLVAGNRCGLLGVGFGDSMAGMAATGGGLWCSLGVIDHCTIVSNAAGEQTLASVGDTKLSAVSGGGLYCSGRAGITNSIVWGNTPDQLVGLECAGVAYCDIQDGSCPINQGNLAVDPAFVLSGHWADAEDPAAIVSATDPGAVWVAGDYRLRADSPCVDAGDPNYAGDPNAVDLDGKTRLAGRAVDMGAYELQSLVPVYCFVSSVTSRYFYTVEESERDALLQMPQLWTSKGIAYRAFASAIEPTLKPVYRFWSDKLSSHFWTISEAEKDALIERYASVWAYEGPVFYAYPEGSQPADAKPVYRFWSGISEAHYYTISETEKNLLMTQGDVWAFEGIAWYAYEPQSTGGQEPPVSQPGQYEFTSERMAASYRIELRAYFDGREVGIDRPTIDLSSAAGRMQMTVDFGAMTTDLAEFQVETGLTEHAAVITSDDASGAEFPLALAIYGLFDTETPRGPFAIDPQTLAFSTVVGGQTSIGDEVLRIVGAALLEGHKHDVNLMLAPTVFETDGRGTFDDSGYPNRLDVNMDGPFQWRRQDREDLLLEANLKGHVLQIYVSSVRIRATGLWLGKSLSGDVKDVK